MIRTLKHTSGGDLTKRKFLYVKVRRTCFWDSGGRNPPLANPLFECQV
jgi:hypothetical protein